MAQLSGSSIAKAYFTNLDRPKETFYVQFNPKEFKLDEKARWKTSEEVGNTKPPLTYERGDPSSISMELVFDSTDSDENVYERFVVPLRNFLTASVGVEDPADKKVSGERPPFCKFTWGEFEFECVIEGIGVTFLMFRADGTPVRARVSLTLKEAARELSRDSTYGAKVELSPGVDAPGGSSVLKTGQGDTLSSVSQQTGVSMQAIALANNIHDPLDIPPGTELVIPANQALAEALGAFFRSEAPGNWREDPADQIMNGLEADQVGDAPQLQDASFDAAYVSFDAEAQAPTVRARRPSGPAPSAAELARAASRPAIDEGAQAAAPPLTESDRPAPEGARPGSGDQSAATGE